MEKRPYYNQAQKLCPKCGEWKLHTRGRKYYTCLTCGLRTPKKQANPRLHADGGQAGDQSGQESLPAAGKA